MNTKNNQNAIRPLWAVCTFLSLIFSFNTLFAQLDNADLVLGRTEENFLSKTTATFDLVVGVKECVTSAISYDEMNGKKVITGYFPVLKMKSAFMPLPLLKREQTSPSLYSFHSSINEILKHYFIRTCSAQLFYFIENVLIPRFNGWTMLLIVTF